MRAVFAAAVICALTGQTPAPGQATETGAASADTTQGRLVTRDHECTVDFPLEHTEVRIRVDGFLADATVTQRFRNPYPRKIEAVYLFPLPTDAAVNQMEIATSGRVVRGRIHRREEARRIYRRAKRRGLVAALLTQERPNLFTQSVANIEPGAVVEVTLRYVQPLDYRDGGYQLVFPMVAGPRYLPEGTDPAVAAAVQPVALAPGVRSSHDIGLEVDIDAGVPLRALESPSHRLEVERDGARARVRLAAGDTIPNKDFTLRYRVAGAAPEFALIGHRDGGPGSFFFLAQPPAVEAATVTPREIVFVLDTSASMAGAPLDKAKQLIRTVLGGLRADDTYQIVRFDDDASALGPRPIANKPKNIGYTLDWLDALPAGGGTEMVGGIAAALEVPHDPARLRIVVFVTDGYVGNEDQILALVGRKMGAARLFSFGVGSAVNRYLLGEMAAFGRGEAQFVRPDEDSATVVGRFYDRIDRPVLTDIRIDWNGLAVTDLVPARVPDLFAGQPLVLSGHYLTPGTAEVTVHGRQGGREVSFAVPVTLPGRADRPAVATVWARRRIVELSRRMIRDPDPKLEEEVVAIALEHQLMTRYTAFVAVDESRITAGGDAERVVVPVEVPEGVRGIGAAGAYGGLMGSSIGTMGGGYGFGTVGYGSGGGGVGYGYGSASVAHNASAVPQVRIGAAYATGDLDKTIIRRYVRRKLPAIRYCYQKRLLALPDLEGTVTVEFTIDADGVIGNVKASGLGDAEVEQCVAGVVRGIQFPAVGYHGDSLIVVRYPFVLRLGDDARRDQAERKENAVSPVPDVAIDQVEGQR